MAKTRSTALPLFSLLLGALVTGMAPSQNLVRDINATAPGVNSNPQALTASGGYVYFSADDGIHGREVWYTDGSVAQLLTDLRPGALSSNPGGFYPFGGGVIVFADDGVHGIEMYQVSLAGAVLLEINPGAQGTAFGVGVAFGGRFFITAWTAANGYELWVTDGGSVSLLRDIVPGPGDGVASYAGLAVVGNLVLFNGRDPARGMELWGTDGTAAGTMLVRDIAPGSSNGMGSGNNFVSDGTFAYFMAYEPATGNELWRSDGTPAGTTMVQDLVPGAGSSMPQPRAFRGQLLYMIAQTPATGWEVFALAGGTISLLKDCTPGAANSSLSAFTAAGDLLFFSLTTASTAQIWRSDGTTPGTFPVTGVPTLPAAAAPGQLDAVGRGTRVVFAGIEAGITGTEPWLSDGTIAGTVRLMDLAPGSASSNPLGFLVVRNTVVFAATQAPFGRELFSMPLSLTRGCIVETLLPGCPGPNGRWPALDGYGIPRFGNAGFALHLTGATPNTAAGFVLSYSGNPGLGGCNPQVGAAAASLMVVTSATGFASMPLGIPNNPTWLSCELFAQAAVLQPGGGFMGIATLSNGLRIVVGDS